MKMFDCFCLWSDLLGYGQGFYRSNWNIDSQLAQRNIERINVLQDEWLLISNLFYETIFTLNDGLVRNFDLSNGPFTSTLSWIEDCIYRFDSINSRDVKNGFPGLRGVLSFGQRVEYIKESYQSMGEFIQTCPKRKRQYNKKITVYSPSELQMNTAFSKAYIMEESGSALGVTGNKLYIDNNVIQRIVDIANSGVCDRFGRIDGDPRPPAVYTFSATFTENSECAILLVETICCGESWTSFKVLFEPGKEYKNEKASINTKLFVPISVESALYGPNREE